MAGRENQTMRPRVVKVLRPLDAVSVENGETHPGTPDVNYMEGWLELKQVDLPKRETTALRVPHFTQQQRVWLKRRWFRGGEVYMLLQAGPHWLLIDGDVAAEKVGRVTFADLLPLARKAWLGGLNEKELLCLLRKGRQASD